MNGNATGTGRDENGRTEEMVTPRRDLPRHADDARLEAIAVTMDAKETARSITANLRRGDKVGALADTADLRDLLGELHRILLEQGYKTFEKEGD